MTRIDAEALEKAQEAVVGSYTGSLADEFLHAITANAITTYLSALPATGGVGTYAESAKWLEDRCEGGHCGEGRVEGFERRRRNDILEDAARDLRALAPSAIQGLESREPEGSLEVEPAREAISSFLQDRDEALGTDADDVERQESAKAILQKLYALIDELAEPLQAKAKP